MASNTNTKYIISMKNINVKINAYRKMTIQFMYLYNTGTYHTRLKQYFCDDSKPNTKFLYIYI